MRFAIETCPECGAPLAGTVEIVSGVAELVQQPDGSYEYGGYTEVDWNSQTTITPEGIGNEWGNPVNDPPASGVDPVLVSCGDHEWWTERDE